MNPDNLLLTFINKRSDLKDQNGQLHIIVIFFAGLLPLIMKQQRVSVSSSFRLYKTRPELIAINAVSAFSLAILFINFVSTTRQAAIFKLTGGAFS